MLLPRRRRVAARRLQGGESCWFAAVRSQRCLCLSKPNQLLLYGRGTAMALELRLASVLPNASMPPASRRRCPVIALTPDSEPWFRADSPQCCHLKVQSIQSRYHFVNTMMRVSIAALCCTAAQAFVGPQVARVSSVAVQAAPRDDAAKPLAALAPAAQLAGALTLATITIGAPEVACARSVSKL